MPIDPSDPSSPKPSTRLPQTTPDAPAGGGGAVFFVILLVLLLGGGGAYYFLVYKPAASAGGTIIAPPTAAVAPKATPAPKAATPDPSNYGSAQRIQYIKQADESFLALRDAKTGPFTTAFNALLTSGGFNAAGLTSKDAITARRNLVAQCQTANDDYEAFTKTQDATFKAELQKTPLKPEDVDYVLSDFSYKAQTDKNVQLRGLQRDSLKTGDELLAYLEKTYGNWSVNAAQHLVFKKSADSGPFSALGKQYNDQVTAMNKLQAEIKATADPTSVATGTPAASPSSAASPAVSPSAAPTATPAASTKP